MNAMNIKTLAYITLIGTLVSAGSAAADFDQEHSAWDRLLKAHVQWINDGTASVVDYAGFKRDHEKLRAYLDRLSGVSMETFDSWTKDQRLAFLINAYNAFTVELILSKYPNLESIKDLGSLFSNPWKKEFFTLLGKKRNLDWIEHERIRKDGVYDDPRIHAAVNCASIGCPALRDEAFTAPKLDRQLEDQMRRFLKDRTRNRNNPDTGKLEVSKIFDWYGGDFSRGWMGYDSLKGFFAKYADLLADAPENVEKIKNQKADISFLDYDWKLNDVT